MPEADLAFRIRGMDCGEEVAVLRQALGPLVGGEGRLAFDLLKGKLTVSPGAETPTPEVILAAISETGMSATPWESAPAREDFWTRSGRSILCGVSGVALALGIAALTLPAFQVSPLAARGLLGVSVVSGGWFIFPKALYALRTLRPDMNLLMSISVLGALTLGEWIEAGAVTFLFSFALLLESWSIGRARRAIEEVVALTPRTARYLCPDDGDVMVKPVEQVPLGVTVLVPPGERVPLDGEVTKGSSHVNEAPITGESAMVRKAPGDTVFAGCINGDGALEFRCTALAGDTQLARIVRLVEEAQASRAPSEQWVDRFARVYTPAMILLALLLALLPPLLFREPWGTWFYRALVTLVIACPCALVLSTPVSIVSALTAAARQGVLVKGGVHLEQAAALQVIAMDKTGTLTRGRPAVQEILALEGHTAAELLRIAAALEIHSTHPLAHAILEKAEEEGLALKPAESFRNLPGKGAEGTVDGVEYWIGSHRLLEERGSETPAIHERIEEMEDAGHSIVALGRADHVCGLVTVSDQLRPEAPALVEALRQAGIEQVVMLTGDNRQTAKAVAEATGISNFEAELLPDEKLRAIEALREGGKSVAMIGDGVNDAPAMAAASLGIAMGAGGTAVAIETADIALMSDDLARVPWLILHARRTLRIIHQNVVFSLGLKGLFILLNLFGHATLWMAIAADMGASLLVIFNGLRLLGSTTGKQRPHGS